MIIFDEYADIGTHWISPHSNGGNTITYFESFEVEHIPKEIKKFIKGLTITTNIFGIQAYDTALSGNFCIGFYFMFKGKNLIDFTNLFLPNNFKDNDILKYIKNE